MRLLNWSNISLELVGRVFAILGSLKTEQTDGDQQVRTPASNQLDTAVPEAARWISPISWSRPCRQPKVLAD